jgi:hypothetical protein
VQQLEALCGRGDDTGHTSHIAAGLAEARDQAKLYRVGAY